MPITKALLIDVNEKVSGIQRESSNTHRYPHSGQATDYNNPVANDRKACHVFNAQYTLIAFEAHWNGCKIHFCFCLVQFCIFQFNDNEVMSAAKIQKWMQNSLLFLLLFTDYHTYGRKTMASTVANRSFLTWYRRELSPIRTFFFQKLTISCRNDTIILDIASVYKLLPKHERWAIYYGDSNSESSISS